jgi:tetratricopeptide (TPR) repeat protein
LVAAAVLALGIGLGIAPATLRNSVVADELVLISSQGGLTFYQGNNERAIGVYMPVPGFSGDPLRAGEEEIELAEKAVGRELTRAEARRYWLDRGTSFLLDNPGRALSLLGNKLLFWLGSDEQSTEYVLKTERELTPTLWLMFLPFAAIVALAAVGIRATGRGDAQQVLLYLFILINLASVLIFYFSSRYRLPAVPFLCVLAGAGIMTVRDRYRARVEGKALLLWLLPAVVVFFLSLYRWTEGYRVQAANQYYNIGNRYYDWKMYDQALSTYQKALPALGWRWQLHFNIGNTQRRLGNHRAAAEAYEQVLKKRPGFTGARKRFREMRDRIAEADSGPSGR